MIVVGHIIMILGAVFMLLAAVGSVRMPDLMTRMHATTKAGAFGAGLMLIGVTAVTAVVAVAAARRK